MHVLPARGKKTDKDNGQGKTFKEKREAQKKADAEAEHTWNTLFMRVCFEDGDPLRDFLLLLVVC